jgi:glucokinase
VTSLSLGLDVGGSAVKWVLLTADRQVVDSGSLPTPSTGPDDVVTALGQLVSGPGANAEAVGLGVPAHVDRTTGTVKLLPNIPGRWTDYPLGRRLAELTRRPVRVLNDARAFGYAELHVGAGRGNRTGVFITVGTGIGGAVALEGQILHSDNDAAGELGHALVEPEGLPCGCGGTGCLETVASAPALVAAAARGVLLGHSPALQRATGGSLDGLTPAMVTEAAAAGDEFCLRLLARAGRAMGLAVGNLCAILTVDMVVIGGGASGAIDQLLPHVQKELDKRASLVPGIHVRRAELGATAGAVGAALWAMDNTSTDEC